MNLDSEFSFRSIGARLRWSFFFLIVMFGCQVQAADIRKADVIAVYFTADWCQPCKPFTALLADVGNRFDGEPVLGIVFDYTNRSTREDAEMHASALALQPLWQHNSDQLGMLYLLDARTKKVLASITPDRDFDAVVNKVTAALENAGS